MMSGIVIADGILRKIPSHCGRFGLSNYLIYGFVLALSVLLFMAMGIKSGNIVRRTSGKRLP